MRHDLTIIIPSFNTKNITLKCLDSLCQGLKKASNNFRYEIIVVDNNSTDGSKELLLQIERKLPNFKLILNNENHGFSKANNQALKLATGRYILFLNSDVIIDQVDFEWLVDYIDRDSQIGALTVKVVLPTGSIDPASHRGFPTPWNSFCYFTQLERVFGKLPGLGRLFGGYHLTSAKLNTIHEIDSPTGAFFLVKRVILDKIGDFSEDFFMYGEDLDLAYRIKSAGYKILYYPLYQVTHLKSSSGLKKVNKDVKNNTQDYFYDAMKIFYKKHYEKKTPWFMNKLIYGFIDLRKRL